jgi:hypothetical protein
MFKRIVWMGTGMAVGAGGAFWAKRKAEEAVERYLPEQVANRVATSARDLGRTVAAAASEGREAKRQRERELRRQVDARTFVGRTSPRPGRTPEAVGGGQRAGHAFPPRMAPRNGPSGPRRRARR